MSVGWHWTEEARARVSGRANPHKGYPPSEETRARISAANKGRHKTDEQRARQSAGMMGHPSRNSSLEARANMSAAMKKSYLNHVRPPMSEEHKAKIGKANKGQSRSEEQRARQSAAEKGRRPSDACLVAGHTPEAQAKRTAKGKGRVKSAETLLKITGENNPLWKGGRKAAHVRDKAKRRGLPSDLIFLNLPFDGCDGHHMQDGVHGAYVPGWMHDGVDHDFRSGRGMAEMDALALAYVGLTADVLDDALPFD
jgi:hypothetical protein